MSVSAKAGALASAAFVMSTLLVGPTFSQSASVAGVMEICEPVIAQEYQGDVTRYGQCVDSVKAFVTTIGAPSDPTNQQVADLVVALANLYQTLDECVTPDTELPEALDVAAAASSDEEQKAQILEVRATIYSCEVGTTADIGLQDAVTDQPPGSSPF